MISKINKFLKITKDKGLITSLSKLNLYIHYKLNNDSDQQIKYHKKNIFYIKTNKCSSLNGFTYGKNDWHPFVKQLEQFEHEGYVGYENSIIKRFKESFSRDNINEVLLGNNINIDKFIPEKFKIRNKNKLSKPLKIYFNEKHFNKEEYYYHDETINIFNEPEHVNRLYEIYTSINNNGYNPELFSNNKFGDYYIRGILLKNNYDFHFIILGGRHRAAALSYFGYDKIPVVFHDNKSVFSNTYPQILDIDNISNWPIIKNDIYPKELVKLTKEDRKMADKLFELFYPEISSGHDRSQASKEALSKALELKISAGRNIIDLMKIMKQEEKLNNSIGFFFSGKKTGIDLQNIRDTYIEDNDKINDFEDEE